jgi:hypothetical protein
MAKGEVTLTLCRVPMTRKYNMWRRREEQIEYVSCSRRFLRSSELLTNNEQTTEQVTTMYIEL